MFTNVWRITGYSRHNDKRWLQELFPGMGQVYHITRRVRWRGFKVIYTHFAVRTWGGRDTTNLLERFGENLISLRPSPHVYGYFWTRTFLVILSCRCSNRKREHKPLIWGHQPQDRTAVLKWRKGRGKKRICIWKWMGSRITYRIFWRLNSTVW